MDAFVPGGKCGTGGSERPGEVASGFEPHFNQVSFNLLPLLCCCAALFGLKEVQTE